MSGFTVFILVVIAFLVLSLLISVLAADSNVKVFKIASGLTMAKYHFNNFVEENKAHGIDIKVVKIEYKHSIWSLDQVWYYYTEEKSNATNEK